MITEDLNIFFSDFGVSVTAGAVSGLGILDMPGEVEFDGVRETYTGAISNGYRLTCKAEDFGWLSYGDMLQIADKSYRVQELLLISDGKLCNVQVEKVSDEPVQFVFDGDFE